MFPDSPEPRQTNVCTLALDRYLPMNGPDFQYKTSAKRIACNEVWWDTKMTVEDRKHVCPTIGHFIDKCVNSFILDPKCIYLKCLGGFIYKNVFEKNSFFFMLLAKKTNFGDTCCSLSSNGVSVLF